MRRTAGQGCWATPRHLCRGCVGLFIEIDGIDITPYIAYGGLSMRREDVDGPDAGRDLNAELHRNRVATKYRFDVTCRPLYDDELGKILQLIKPEFVNVRYYHPEMQSIVTRTMYSNNVSITYQQIYKNGRELWGGITFPLIEK